MTKTYISLFMLLTLTAGVVHNLQHDWASEQAVEITDAAHLVSFNLPNLHHAHHEAPHRHEGDKSKESHGERDCLLGDLTATPSCGSSLPKQNFILPKPTQPTLVLPTRHTQSLPPVRAPPLSL